MKKLLFSLAVLSAVAVTAQVGINTDTPEATLDIRAKEDQKGDLRIEGVEEGKSTQWLLIWDEEDQKVKRRSLLEIKRKTLNEIRIDYIREKQPTKADEIINKIKQCAPENRIFDKHFGDGKHDFVYCATTVSEGGYNKTWLNLNLGAEYANIHSPHFDPTVKKTGTDAHDDAKTYGSLYQWQRASDGHEFRNSETTEQQAQSWTNAGSSAGKFLANRTANWVRGGENASGANLELWRADGRNNPCPLGYHVPTKQEWDELLNAVGSQMWVQTELPNLAAAGYRRYNDGLLDRRSRGDYWGSSAYDSSNYPSHIYSHDTYSNFAHYMYFYGGNSSGTASNSRRANGHSVRCIKDNN